MEKSDGDILRETQISQFYRYETDMHYQSLG